MEASLVTMTFRGQVLDFQTEVSAGVTEMCLRDFDVLDCGEDDGSGFNMTVPQGEDFLMDLSNPGYGPHLLHARGLAATNFEFGMLDQSALDELAEVAGTTTTDGKGVVLIEIREGEDLGLSGAVAQLNGSGITPTYYSNLGAPDDLLTNTSGNGHVAFGGVAPGSYSISLSYPTELCGSFFRGTNEDGVFEIVVEAGKVTHGGRFECSDRIQPADGGDETETGTG
jgi:hypothetical protein